MNRWTTLRPAAATVFATLALATLVAPVGRAAPAWGTGPVVVTRDVSPEPRVVDLRVGQHAHFDRVVVDLHGRLPGYSARYVHRLQYDGSGEAVPLRGRRFVAVAVVPARAHRADRRPGVAAGVWRSASGCAPR